MLIKILYFFVLKIIISFRYNNVSRKLGGVCGNLKSNNKVKQLYKILPTCKNKINIGNIIKVKDEETIDKLNNIKLSLNKCKNIMEIDGFCISKDNKNLYLNENNKYLPFLFDFYNKNKYITKNKIYLYNYLIQTVKSLKCMHEKKIFVVNGFDNNSFYIDKNNDSKIIFSNYNLLNYMKFEKLDYYSDIWNKELLNIYINKDFNNLALFFYNLRFNTKLKNINDINKFPTDNIFLTEIFKLIN